MRGEGTIRQEKKVDQIGGDDGYQFVSYWLLAIGHWLFPSTTFLYCTISTAFSLRAITTVATVLPIMLVIARPSLIKRSTPTSKASPSTGTTFIAVRVEVSTRKPLPVTP